MKRFKSITSNNICVMGSRTWLSLPKKPLPNRINVVLSSHHQSNFPGAHMVLGNSTLGGDLDTVKFQGYINKDVIYMLEKEWPTKDIFIIGGVNIFKMFRPYATRIYLTFIQEEYLHGISINFAHLLNGCIITEDKVINQNNEIFYHLQEYTCHIDLHGQEMLPEPEPETI
jgi:dihydrofolate reductase